MTQIFYLNDYRNQPSLSRFVRKKNANANAIKSHDDLPLVGPVFGRALCIERKKNQTGWNWGLIGALSMTAFSWVLICQALAQVWPVLKF